MTTAISKEFMNRVDKSLQRIYNASPLPVILVGDSRTLGFYEQVCDNSSIILGKVDNLHILKMAMPKRSSMAFKSWLKISVKLVTKLPKVNLKKLVTKKWFAQTYNKSIVLPLRVMRLPCLFAKVIAYLQPSMNKTQLYWLPKMQPMMA